MTRLPVTLLTGFLGSGKTTLLNAWLRTGALGPTAVIVNEAGAVAIDHLLVEQGSEDTVLIDGGCVCCAARSGLAEAVDGLFRRRADGRVPPFQRIVIETSGLADPVPIIQTFIADRRLARQTRLTTVIATVDLTTAAATLQHHPESIAQIAVADTLLLTMGERADAPTAARAEDALATLNPHATRRRVQPGTFDPAWLVPADWAALADRPPRQQSAVPHDGVHVVSASFPGQLSADALDDWLDDTVGVFGQSLLRLKAILSICGQDDPVVLHGVGHVVHAPERLPHRHGPRMANRVLLIGRGLDRVVLDDAIAGLAAACREYAC